MTVRKQSTEVNHSVPKWVEVSIGEISDVVAGGTPKAGDPSNFANPGTAISWLTPADLSRYSEKYISYGKRDLSQQGYDSSSAKLMPQGSLLFSSRAPIGYVVIANNQISTNQGFKNFVFTKSVDSSYAYYYLRSIRELAEGLGTGTTFKEISGATAKKLPFVLPPLAEQKVIADKLDTLLAQVETTKARLDRIPKILKTFRQSILAAAVSGKLTIGRTKWRNELLKNCFECIDGDRGPNYPKKDDYLQNGYCLFLSTKNVRQFGFNFSDTVFISQEKESILRKGRLERGDIIITTRGTLGYVASYDETVPYDVVRINSGMLILRKKDEQFINDYFKILVASPYFQKLIEDQRTGSAQPQLPAKILKDFILPVPGYDEQTKIVRRVEELFAFADSIEQKANSALERVNNLTQSILAKAFRGELTVDWRAQNPDLISGENSAEALLEKIKIEREALKNQPKPKRIAKKKKIGSRMSKQIIKVVDALKQAAKPLSGQQLLAAAGYPSDSSTDQLEQFLLDIREALATEKSIVKLERGDDGQDWFALAEADEINKA